MKRGPILLLAFAMLFGFAATSSALTLFSEDFEGDLSAWTGGSDSHNGAIMLDPKDSSNKVLYFKALDAGGDIFSTAAAYSSTSGKFILEFDYLGIKDSGGFIGHSAAATPGVPHTWLAGADEDYSGTESWPLTLGNDDYEWHHYVLHFESATSRHLMLEEFSGSDSIIGNAFFDNILLTDLDGATVPEPGTILLLGAGLLGLIGVRRKFKS